MTTIQTAWSEKNVRGHSIDPNTSQIDTTEGFGAFDSIFESHGGGYRVVDVGGGEYNDNAAYCSEKFSKRLSIYDPFMREEAHNESIINEAKERKFDSATSIGVLNVIDNDEARKEHIRLCKSLVKETGKVFFKVWPGDGSGRGKTSPNKYQSNRGYMSYVPEIRKIFGSGSVIIDNRNEIIIGTSDKRVLSLFRAFAR